MLGKICYQYGNIQEFDLSGLLISMGNLAYSFVIVLLFMMRPSVLTGFFFMLILVFNHFHYKINCVGNASSPFFKKNFD